MTQNQSNKDKHFIQARNSHITKALNLIIYIYVYVMLGDHFDDVIILI